MVGVNQHDPYHPVTAMNDAPRAGEREPRKPIGVVVAEDSYVIREFLTATLTASRDRS